MEGREPIKCHGRLLAEIDIRERKLYLWCKRHSQSEPVDLQPFIERMLAVEMEQEQDRKPAIRRLVAS